MQREYMAATVPLNPTSDRAGEIILEPIALELSLSRAIQNA